jgi:hypothetical protein
MCRSLPFSRVPHKTGAAAAIGTTPGARGASIPRQRHWTLVARWRHNPAAPTGGAPPAMVRRVGMALAAVLGV